MKTALLFIVPLCLFTPSFLHAQTAVPVSPVEVDSLAWYRVADWGVEGRAWSEVARTYDRLPASASGVVRDKVWELSRHSAGMMCRFETDAQTIFVRYSLLLDRLEMTHMPATGVSGVDLYAMSGGGTWKWIGVAHPRARRVRTVVVSGMEPGEKSLSLYLPLYNGIDSLEIGVAPGSAFAGIRPRREKPIVFYGTSIMHGACASRPGMAIPAILGRRMDIPTVNLGFSGNGKLETEVGAFIASLDAAVFVLDCLPNLNPSETAERTVPFVRLLREKHPDTPILLVEDRTFAGAFVNPARMQAHGERRAAFRAAFDLLRNAGDANLYYLEGEDLLGDDGEATVDGSHPTDLGMMRYADAYEPVLRKILRR